MTIEYCCYPVHGIIVAKGRRVVTVQDLINYTTSILEILNDRTGTVEYLDLSEAEEIDLSYESAHLLIDLYRKMIERGIEGSVIYAPTDVSYGTARMMSGILAALWDNPGDGPVVTRVPVQFHDVKAWFEQQLRHRKREELRLFSSKTVRSTGVISK